MTTPEQMREIAQKLLELGYTPLRIDPGSKAAKHQGWQAETPTEESIARSFNSPSNLGVRCGDMRSDGTCLLAIDVDLNDEGLLDCVRRAIGNPDVPVKRGKKGATFFVRLDREQKTTKIKLVRDGLKLDAIDILCRGAQTVVPPSIHPDTRAPYEWIAGRPLWDVDYRSLPIYGPALLDEIRGYCKDPEDPVASLNEMVWAGVGGGGNTHDTCVRAVSSMVARKWSDDEIHQRVQRAKQDACAIAGMPYHWPEAHRVVQEWIDSSREKKFDKTSKNAVRLDDVPPDIVQRYVYIASVDRMYDLRKGVMLNMHVFNNMLAREIPKPWITLLMHPDFKIVDRLTYIPGQPMFCQEQSFESECLHDCLNLYNPPDVAPCEGNVEPFLELVHHLFDRDEGAVNHVLSFFAYAVQNPGARINHGLVIQGNQGIGKDSILHAIEKVLGSHNCTQVSLQQIESQFNEWVFGKQMIVFQELLAAGRKGIYNKLKTVITEPMHTVNAKHLALQRVSNRAIYVFLTNYTHAMSIDSHDRRVWVWNSKANPLPPTFYQKYYGWLNDKRNADALCYFLLNYDISTFNPAAPPPMTDAKRMLIRSSANEVEQVLREAMESGTWPMSCDLIYPPHLQSALRSIMRVSLSMINEALDHISPGGTLLQRPRFGNSRPKLRAIRNLQKWRLATPEAISSEYRMPLPPAQGENEGTYQIFAGADVSGDSGDDAY